MSLNLFGYSNVEESELLTLNEVTIQADTTKLRALAKFINKCADEIDSDEGWEHEHFRDYIDDESIEHDVIVFKL